MREFVKFVKPDVISEQYYNNTKKIILKKPDYDIGSGFHTIRSAFSDLLIPIVVLSIVLLIFTTGDFATNA